MLTNPDQSSTTSARNALTVAAAVLLLTAALMFLGSCGSEDLVFPGKFAFTVTGQPTSTPVNTPSN